MQVSPVMSAKQSTSVTPAVLSTLNQDGSRRWMKPKPSPGRFMTRRRITAYTLIAIFALLPLIHIGGHPIVLLDVVARRFHIFGKTFYPTDTLLLALLVVSCFLSIFWITALLGRVWCGWACPQTVYMEFLFRPIERFFEGTPGRAKRGWLQSTRAGSVLKFAAYFICSILLAHTFLAYFVSWDNLQLWVFGSPTAHFPGFLTVMIVTGAMLFDFGYFREQVCLVACPYGRLQSVLLDRHSMTVRYDVSRGEPRGARKRNVELPVLSNTVPAPGDCIDCKMCVTTCPTGIDIRNGLQMECIDCTQCIDACDAVMEKTSRPRGLIRYSSQAAMSGEKFKFIRPRVILYPLVLIALGTLFTFVLLQTGVADVTVLRGLGQPFNTSADGRIENNLRIKIVNRLDRPAHFTISISGSGDPKLTTEQPDVIVPPGQMLTFPAQVYISRSAFIGGKAQTLVTVNGPENFSQSLSFTAVGPFAQTSSQGEHK